MKILIVAATAEEIAPSIPFLEREGIGYLITGVGMVATAYALGRELARGEIDLAINVGIAGAWTEELALGDVVEVVEDRIVDFGAESESGFISIDTLGFGKSVFSARTAGLIPAGLVRTAGVTVNKAHGTQRSIGEFRLGLISATTESMEGASFFYSAEQAGIFALQVRAISNYVTPRNTSAWDIPKAVKSLNEWLQSYVAQCMGEKFSSK